MKELYFGAAYYPEVWDESEIDKDIAKMHEAGLNCMRIAEFAWSSMEPKEGVFKLDWLVRVVDKLYAAGIYTVMCTPSVTPPKWLTDKYPETLQVLDNGTARQFGGRCHVCKTSEVMREKNRIIVTEMCKALGKHPGIVGWQIDNEFYTYDRGCFCPKCREKFTRWLEEKYKTVDALNKAWKTARWSLTYNSFADVIPPRSDTWNHPSLLVEWIRFQADNTIEYCVEQADVIRRYTDAPIGTDMMPAMNIDHCKMNAALDVVQFNHYEPYNELYKPSFWFDYMRPIKKDQPFWNTETQCCWNGSEFANCGHRPAGNCYVNTLLPVLKGGEMNLYWLWRTHPCGHEIGHGAVLTSAGRFNHTIVETQRAVADANKCKHFLTGTKVKNEIAVHFSTTAALNLRYAPLVKGLDYVKTVMDYTTALRHYGADVIGTGASLDGYKVVISPLLSCVDENGLKERMLDFVEQGGTWIVGPMSDIMTDYACKYTDAPYGFLEDVVGVYTKYQFPLPNDVFTAVWKNGDELPISLNFDGYELCGADSLADYTNDYLHGLCAIAARKVGKGKIILLGTLIEREQLQKLLPVEKIAQASDNVELIRRAGKTDGLIAVEMYAQPGTVTLDGAYTDLVTGKRCIGTVSLEPYQVCVFQK